jgi:hypothetical protein
VLQELEFTLFARRDFVEQCGGAVAAATANHFGYK